jgi:hypothetical protein
MKVSFLTDVAHCNVSVRFPRSDGMMECLLDVHHRKWTS